MRPLPIIDGDILPEVRQLQGRAGVIGKLLALPSRISAQIQHQMSHRIGRIAAVAQQIVESLDSG